MTRYNDFQIFTVTVDRENACLFVSDIILILLIYTQIFYINQTGKQATG